MFPIDPKQIPQHPSDIINDPKVHKQKQSIITTHLTPSYFGQAKALWDTHIGKDEYMCDFKVLIVFLWKTFIGLYSFSTN